MAFTPNQYLVNKTDTLFRDQQHAARVFTDDQFRLAPKHKFLFHVAFSINSSALKDINLVQRHRNEINVMVKSVDLPRFTIQTETLNQYNRKKVVQYQQKYNPINVVFHDDNMGLINALWQNYYSYYYSDPISAYDAGAYQRNATRSSDFIKTTFGFDNGSTIPFFNKITVYQMARHEYVSYTLHNPIITEWNHNKLDYSDGKSTHDNNMQIAYEAVSYNAGDVKAGDPEGFGLEHYDQTPSPLQGSLYANPTSPTMTNDNSANSAEFLNTVISQINSYQNTQEKGTGTSSVLSNIVQTAQQGVSGVQGIAFPVSVSGKNTIVASQSTVGK